MKPVAAPALDAALDTARASRERFLGRLGEWLAIPSISTDSRHRDDVRRAATWAAEYLRRLGFDNVELLPPDAHPLVAGERLAAGPGAPTVLVYGHYDVQPPEPLEPWESPPFEATVRGDHLYARGGADMKGQFASVLFAIESILENDDLPVNVRVLLEGQEEIGSPDLAEVLESHRERFAADFCLNPDTGMLAPDEPTIIASVRGIAYYEVTVGGPSADLHSGAFGGAIHNPAQVLAELLSGLHDADGRVTLPGFYDRVREVGDGERAELARAGRGEEFYLEQSGVPRLWGEPEFTPDERIAFRPTLEIHGLSSGYTGEGQKTIIPSSATAKLSTRLVPDQDSSAVHGQLRAYLEEHAPPTVTWRLTELTHAPPAISDRSSPWIQAMARAQEAVWGKAPVFWRGGGSVPVIGHLQAILGVESVNVGWALPGGNVHAPNERLHLPTWQRGIETLVRFFYEVGRA